MHTPTRKLGNVLFCLVCPSAVAQAYRVIDLHPVSGFNDSYGYAVDRGNVVGYARHDEDLPAFLEPRHAFLWDHSTSTSVNLHPEDLSNTMVFGVREDVQVGWGRGTGEGDDWQAMFWRGTASSATKIHPAGFTRSQARSVRGNQAVGTASGANSNITEAMLWDLSSGEVTNLHPTGFSSSSAAAITGAYQVGWGTERLTGGVHALLWRGTAENLIDLHPPEFGTNPTWAYGAGGDQQVGRVVLADGVSHALLWAGTATSVIDLNGPGFASSVAYGTNGRQQVGGAAVAGTSHPIVWNSSASDYVLLDAFLPAGFRSASALDIDEDGNIAGYAVSADGSRHAILWVPVPEPTAVLGILVVSLQMRRFRKNRPWIKASWPIHKGRAVCEHDADA